MWWSRRRSTTRPRREVGLGFRAVALLAGLEVELRGLVQAPLSLPQLCVTSMCDPPSLPPSPSPSPSQLRSLPLSISLSLVPHLCLSALALWQILTVALTVPLLWSVSLSRASRSYTRRTSKTQVLQPLRYRGERCVWRDHVHEIFMCVVRGTQKNNRMLSLSLSPTWNMVLCLVTCSASALWRDAPRSVLATTFIPLVAFSSPPSRTVDRSRAARSRLGRSPRFSLTLTHLQLLALAT